MQAVQQAFFAELFEDVLGFAGAVIIRRILGIAHVTDYESIKDADARCASPDDLSLRHPQAAWHCRPDAHVAGSL